MTRTYVLLFCAAIALIIAGVDIYLYIDDIPGNSITQIVIWASEKTPLVPAFGGFLMGFLMAHFWDTKKQEKSDKP